MNPPGEPKQRLIMERMGRIEEAGREFDIEFWQRLGPAAIFDAAWEMVHDAWTFKGRELDELRFQRSAENLQRRIR